MAVLHLPDETSPDSPDMWPFSGEFPFGNKDGAHIVDFDVTVPILRLKTDARKDPKRQSTTFQLDPLAVDRPDVGFGVRKKIVKTERAPLTFVDELGNTRVVGESSDSEGVGESDSPLPGTGNFFPVFLFCPHRGRMLHPREVPSTCSCGL